MSPTIKSIAAMTVNSRDVLDTSLIKFFSILEERVVGIYNSMTTAILVIYLT